VHATIQRLGLRAEELLKNGTVPTQSSSDGAKEEPKS